MPPEKLHASLPGTDGRASQHALDGSARPAKVLGGKRAAERPPRQTFPSLLSGVCGAAEDAPRACEGARLRYHGPLDGSVRRAPSDGKGRGLGPLTHAVWGGKHRPALLE